METVVCPKKIQMKIKGGKELLCSWSGCRTRRREKFNRTQVTDRRVMLLAELDARLHGKEWQDAGMCVCMCTHGKF